MTGYVSTDERRKLLEETRTGVPKWVRGLVRDLSRERDEATAQRDAARQVASGDGLSKFSVVNGMRADDQRLPASATQLLWCADGTDDVVGQGFALRLYENPNRPGELEVMCTSWHGVKVTPSASNVVSIGRGREK